MFEGVLAGLLERVEGAIAATLIGLDGIEVARAGDDSLVPLELLGAELGSFIKAVSLARTELKSGAVEQLSLATDTYTTFLSSVTPEYFILLVLRRDGNYGRARFELMRAKLALRDELS